MRPGDEFVYDGEVVGTVIGIFNYGVHVRLTRWFNGLDGIHRPGEYVTFLCRPLPPNVSSPTSFAKEIIG